MLKYCLEKTTVQGGTREIRTLKFVKIVKRGNKSKTRLTILVVCI